jgi:hypothetical protein
VPPVCLHGAHWAKAAAHEHLQRRGPQCCTRLARSREALQNPGIHNGKSVWIHISMPPRPLCAAAAAAGMKIFFSGGVKRKKTVGKKRDFSASASVSQRDMWLL